MRGEGAGSGDIGTGVVSRHTMVRAAIRRRVTLDLSIDIFSGDFYYVLIPLRIHLAAVPGRLRGLVLVGQERDVRVVVELFNRPPSIDLILQSEEFTSYLSLCSRHFPSPLNLPDSLFKSLHVSRS